MRLRTYGTGRPHDFSTNLRGGMVLLAALLLICTLMAGAVSADTIEFNQTNFTDGGGTYTISSAGTYVLNETATGNIKITASTDDVTVKATNNAQLTGSIMIFTSATVTIQDMDITMNEAVYQSTKKKYVIWVDGTNIYHPKIILRDSTITFADDVQSRNGYVFYADTDIAGGSKFSGNTIINVSGHALCFKGVADGGTVTVSGNTVTMTPRENIGEQTPNDGRALLKVWYMPSYLTLINGATFIVENNVVSIVSEYSYKVNIVRFDAINAASGHDNDDKIIVKMTNNTLDDDPGSPYLYGGISTVYGGTYDSYMEGTPNGPQETTPADS